MKISLCIPMYNESAVIENTARTLSDYMEKNFSDDGYEIIFSDDGSTDGSLQIVNNLHLPNVCTVGYKDNRGKGSAVRNAVLASHGNIVMFTDADLAYGTEVVKMMVKALDDSPSAKVAIGSRNLDSDGYKEYTFLRKLASKTYIHVLNLVGGFRLSDSQCGCKAYRGEEAKQIFSKCTIDGFAFDLETILRAQKAGYGIIEVPVRIINHRESKIHIFKDTFKMLGDLRKIKKSIKNEDK